MFKNKEDLSALFAIFRMTQDDLLAYNKETLLAAGYGQVLGSAARKAWAPTTGPGFSPSCK